MLDHLIPKEALDNISHRNRSRRTKMAPTSVKQSRLYSAGLGFGFLYAIISLCFLPNKSVFSANTLGIVSRRSEIASYRKEIASYRNEMASRRKETSSYTQEIASYMQGIGSRCIFFATRSSEIDAYVSGIDSHSSEIATYMQGIRARTSEIDARRKVFAHRMGADEGKMSR